MERPFEMVRVDGLIPSGSHFNEALVFVVWSVCETCSQKMPGCIYFFFLVAKIGIIFPASPYSVHNMDFKLILWLCLTNCTLKTLINSSRALLIWCSWDPKWANAGLLQGWNWSHDHTVDGSALGKNQTAHNHDWSSNVYPIRCVPLLSWTEQQGPHIIFQRKHTYICLAELSFPNARNTTCGLDGPRVFPERMFVCVYVCVTTFITPGTRVGLSDRKHSPIQVSGAWVKEGSLPVYVHHCTGVVSARQHVDLSAGPFPADLSTHDWKHDLQLTSGKESASERKTV